MDNIGIICNIIDKLSGYKEIAKAIYPIKKGTIL